MGRISVKKKGGTGRNRRNRIIPLAAFHGNGNNVAAENKNDYLVQTTNKTRLLAPTSQETVSLL
jgi:hypothetical protein